MPTASQPPAPRRCASSRTAPTRSSLEQAGEPAVPEDPALGVAMGAVGHHDNGLKLKRRRHGSGGFSLLVPRQPGPKWPILPARAGIPSATGAGYAAWRSASLDDRS